MVVDVEHEIFVLDDDVDSETVSNGDKLEIEETCIGFGHKRKFNFVFNCDL